MMHFLYKHKGDPNFAMVEVLRLFKVYKASYRVIYKSIVNKRSGEMKIEDFSKETGIEESWLKQNYFHKDLGHFKDSDSISMGLYIEAAVDKRAKIKDNLDDIIDNLTEKEAQ